MQGGGPSPWVHPVAGGVVVVIRVVPRSSRTAIQGWHGAEIALKIRLAAPPVDGKANEELIEFLAERLDVPRRALTLLGGATGREKRIRVEGRTEAEVRRSLAPG